MSGDAKPTLFGLYVPLANELGIVGETIGDDQARMSMPYDQRWSNSRGDVSGGALASLLDFALAAAVRSNDPANFGVATIDLVTHFISPCSGAAIATARCERRGRTLSFARGEVHDDEGRLVATATGTFMLVARDKVASGDKAP